MTGAPCDSAITEHHANEFATCFANERDPRFGPRHLFEAPRLLLFGHRELARLKEHVVRLRIERPKTCDESRRVAQYRLPLAHACRPLRSEEVKEPLCAGEARR